MMNIRDFIFINKVKTVNKIRILDILGFDTNVSLTQSPENIRELNNEVNIEKELINESLTITDDNLNIANENIQITNDNFNIEVEEKILINSTKSFEPLKITSQIKKIWIDIESRRVWLVPAALIISTIILISSVIGIFINNRNREMEIINQYATLSIETNELIKILPSIIEISTDNFYSKYDVSNSSATLQLVESTTMEYQRLLLNRSDIGNVGDIDLNLDTVFTLVNQLDKLISYRILASEVLIYNDIFLNIEDTDIDSLSNQLSEISAISKRNYEKLPAIDEFTKHTLLLKETLISAEDLHGRLIASLRNNEIEVSNSLIVAINMNKEVEQNSYNKALNEFKINKSKLYESINSLP